MPKKSRILLKLSGEALAGKAGYGIDPSVCAFVAAETAALYKKGFEIGIVIGGGNIMRGATATGLDRVTADTMGMLATVINSLALAAALGRAGCPAIVLTARRMDAAGGYYTPQRAVKFLRAGAIVLIAGGTGSPYFTTDTAAALRAAETGAHVLLKATKVDGVYDSDPVKNPKARRLDRLTHDEAIKRNLRVMDATAFSFCRENNIPIVVFKLMEKGNLLRAASGSGRVGSIVSTGGSA